MSDVSNIIISGTKGMLGSAFSKILPNALTFSRPELDVTDKNMLEEVILETKPSIFINCAAYTKVDDAEDNVLDVFNTNSITIFNLAKLSLKYDFRVINFSSDYVFPGTNINNINSERNPLNVYGSSKLCGEEFLRYISPKSTTIRTSWIHSHVGKNFVRTMLRLFKIKDELKIVSDQIGSPTYAPDLARIIVNKLINLKMWKPIYHLTNSGYVSWFEFARYIKSFTTYDCTLKSISSSDFNSKASRPTISILQRNVIDEDFSMRSWDEALIDCLRNIKQQNSDFDFNSRIAL